MNNAALMAKLEKAKEGSRALSDEVLLALGWTTVEAGGHEIWNSPDGKLRLAAQFDRPDPTQNLQDAVDEAERRGYGWSAEDTGACFVYQKETVDGEHGHLILGDSDDDVTPPVGMCIAILRALDEND